MEFWIHTEIFPKDNASYHALRIVMEYLDKNDIFTLYWRPQSSDLNIIGNIWDMIKENCIRIPSLSKVNKIS